MKLDGLTHPKTKELALSLGIPLPHAVGLLEFLWAFVAQQTPRGNVGRWSNGVIAQEAQWQGDPDQLVEALVSSGFLDQDADHRLLVHDWSEHAPNWVHAKLKRKGKQIISTDISPDIRCDSDPPSEPTTSLVKPSQGKDGKPSGASGDAPTGKKASKSYPPEFEEIWQSRPKREGGDSKRDAFKAYCARIREGVDHGDLAAGLARYKRYLEAKGKIGTEYVKRMTTFLGPGEHYAEDWAADGEGSDWRSRLAEQDRIFRGCR